MTEQLDLEHYRKLADVYQDTGIGHIAEQLCDEIESLRRQRDRMEYKAIDYFTAIAYWIATGDVYDQCDRCGDCPNCKLAATLDVERWK